MSAVEFSSIFDQLGPESLKLAGEIAGFFARSGRVKRHHHRTLTSPQGLGRAESQKPVALFAQSSKFPVLRDIRLHKVLGIDSGRLLGKARGMSGLLFREIWGLY